MLVKICAVLVMSKTTLVAMLKFKVAVGGNALLTMVRSVPLVTLILPAKVLAPPSTNVPKPILVIL